MCNIVGQYRVAIDSKVCCKDKKGFFLDYEVHVGCVCDTSQATDNARDLAFEDVGEDFLSFTKFASSTAKLKDSKDNTRPDIAAYIRSSNESNKRFSPDNNNGKSRTVLWRRVSHLTPKTIDK